MKGSTRIISGKFKDKAKNKYKYMVDNINNIISSYIRKKSIYI